MEIIFLIFVFIFGTIIGSFLNVVIIRHGTGRSLGGRSKCAITGKTLKWFELIPILSFLIQGGRSRHSKTKISCQYPLVEFFTGALFVLIAYRFFHFFYSSPEIFFSLLIFYYVLFSCLIVIFVYDWQHKIIPTKFLWIFTALSITYICCFSFGNYLTLTSPSVYSILAGPIIALPIYLLWLITSGRGMGFGDVKLALPIGWFLGISAGLAALLLSFWIGAIVGLLLIAFDGKKLKSQIPFGPFLIIGFVIALLYNIDMTSIASFFGNLI